jgi:hypothetical protein
MRFLLTLLLMACSLPTSAATLRDVAEQVRADYGVLAPTAPVVVADCGELNAAYLGDDDVVVLCSELEALPVAQVRFGVAHELAHAAMAEDDIALYDPEAAADELAAIVLGDAGDRAAIDAGAEFFMELARRGHHEDEEHHADLARAFALLCLDDGYDGDQAANPACPVYLDHARAAWVRLFLTAMARE